MQKPRRAVVLLLTLALIALSSLALTRLANHSMETVRQGILAQNDLQQRWMEESCRIALLQRAEKLFAQQDQDLRQQGKGWPLPRTISLRLELGGQSADVVLRDEQASANINLLHAQDPERLPMIVTRSAHLARVPVSLRPLDPSPQDQPPAFVSWGQVVDLSRMDQRESIVESLGLINDTLTCWGQGTLNLSRASDEAIRLVAEPILEPVITQQLIQARRGFDGELQSLWELMGLHRTEQLQFNRRFSTRSRCYSLWLVYQTPGRPKSILMVSQSRNRSGRSTLHWRW